MPPKALAWKTKDRRRLLLAVLGHCCGESLISFEGQLSKLPLAKHQGASTSETAALKRQTLWPKQDFLILRIGQLTASGVMAALGGSIPSAVLHIQIEDNGKLAFGAYDNFQHLHLGESLGERFVDQLVSDGTLQRVDS